MNLVFRFEKKFSKIEERGSQNCFFNKSDFQIRFCSASDTWMCLELGEGELGIENHGRSRFESFSQETGAIGQQPPRNGVRPMLKSQVQDAHDSDSTPHFFFLARAYE